MENDLSELQERLESNAFDIARLQRNLKLEKAQSGDLMRQLSEAWEALAYYAGMDPMDAIDEYKELQDG